MKNWVNRLTERVCAGARWILEMLDCEEPHGYLDNVGFPAAAISAEADPINRARRDAANVLRGRISQLRYELEMTVAQFEYSRRPFPFGAFQKGPDTGSIEGLIEELARLAEDLDPKVAP
ncbi:hypothetical protein BMG03_00990 [Thioclava nitratireducens]|uniref:Uncharacterized protein n=1 Tax=Thioclava nitratireducens TaxID=1915078 RepID=A0ABN4XAA8_9RHOB|nr:hypothetical protein [Thioclava nitratireducens]AQS46531.1 hypothetical protein BMG03_00990 [Thioclava nitratireducens]